MSLLEGIIALVVVVLLGWGAGTVLSVGIKEVLPQESLTIPKCNDCVCTVKGE